MIHTKQPTADQSCRRPSSCICPPRPRLPSEAATVPHFPSNFLNGFISCTFIFLTFVFLDMIPS